MAETAASQEDFFNQPDEIESQIEEEAFFEAMPDFEAADASLYLDTQSSGSFSAEEGDRHSDISNDYPSVTPLGEEGSNDHHLEAYYIPGASLNDEPLPSFELAAPKFPLDPQQQAVARYTSGAALVVAGAGSGKTATVIELTSLQLERGVSPVGYVMLTFSRKAAMEMKTRLKERLGFDSGIEPTTFHAFFFKMMCRAPNRFGLQKEFSIMDDKDQVKVFEYALDKVGIDRSVYPSVQWKSGYSYCKNESLRAGTNYDDMVTIINYMRQFLKPQDEGRLITDEQIVEALLSYETFTHENGLLDYDDLILKPLEAFDAHPEIAAKYADQVKHLIVDEAQDTNLAQYRLIKHLAFRSWNVVMVGDDDQSIYGWRGAKPENMRQFLDDFKATEYLIENNYRSAPEIVIKATKQVRINADRLEKNPKSMARHTTRGEVNLVSTPDTFTMSRDLINRMKREILCGAKPGDIAILYRSNMMLNEIEGELIKSKIPYHVAGTSKLMDRQEAKACIAVARLVINNHDSAALWTASKMLKGVGDKALSILVAHADRTGKALLSDDGINMIAMKKARETLLHFRKVINHLRGATPDQWITTIKKEMMPLEVFKAERKSNPATYNRREANIDQLEQWSINLNCENWHELFEILLEQEDPEKVDPSKAITISTVHKAKGLEWDYVHFIGFTKSKFPMESKKDASDLTATDIDEERRLSYVAITRAKKYIHFYHASRYITSPDKSFSVSPFAQEINFNQHFKVKASGGNYSKRPQHKAKKSWKAAVKSQNRHTP